MHRVAVLEVEGEQVFVLQLPPALAWTSEQGRSITEGVHMSARFCRENDATQSKTKAVTCAAEAANPVELIPHISSAGAAVQCPPALVCGVPSARKKYAWHYPLGDAHRRGDVSQRQMPGRLHWSRRSGSVFAIPKVIHRGILRPIVLRSAG